MKKNISIIILGFLIFIIAIIGIYKHNETYSQKEKIKATINYIEKKKIEYEHYSNKFYRSFTMTSHIHITHYKFDYQGTKKLGSTEFYNLLWRKNTKINIYYDKDNDTSTIYLVPYAWLYLGIIGILWCIIGFKAYQSKYNVKNLFKFGHAPIIVHIFLSVSSFIAYWGVYIHSQRENLGSIFVMFLFMIIHILILCGCFTDIKKYSKSKACEK